MRRKAYRGDQGFQEKGRQAEEGLGGSQEAGSGLGLVVGSP